MLPIAFSTVGSGILFGLFSLASARNPDESEKLYGSTLVAFALMETFVFLGLVIGVLVNFVL
jgi:F0F1-type ATP synthase membrane subunit c/vacuolar-type H+-ATPase subunit K